MKTRSRLLLLVLCLCVHGCPLWESGPPAGVPGEVAWIYDTVPLLRYSSGDHIVYGNYGASIYSVDVTDPREPIERDTRAYGSLACSFESCYDFELLGTRGYLLGYAELASVPLPNAPLAAWIWDLPEPSDYSARSLHQVSAEAFVVVRAGYSSTTYGTSDLLVFDVLPTSDDPQLLSRRKVGFGAAFGGASDGTVVVVPDGDVAVIHVFDTAVLTTMQEIASIPLSLPGTMRPYKLALQGYDLLVAGDLSGCFVGWYRFSPDYQALTEIARNQAWRPNGNLTIEPIIHDDDVFLSASGCDGGTIGYTVAFRLDSSLGLVETGRVAQRDGPLSYAIDKQRGLLYVGSHQGLQILDTGFLTTGTALWPAEP